MNCQEKKENFKCEKLTDDINNKALIKEFKNTRNENLEVYLKNKAWGNEKEGSIVHYLVKNSQNEIVLYFSLKCGVVFGAFKNNKQINDKDKKEFIKKSKNDNSIVRVPKTISGIELCHFCKNEKLSKKLKDQNKGNREIGTYIFFEFIVPIVKEVSNKIGCKILYLFAADDTEDCTLINYYEQSLYFRRLTKSYKSESYVPAMSYYEDGCEFMYIKIKNLINDKKMDNK